MMNRSCGVSRLARLIVIAALTGCSPYFVNSGQHLRELKTRDEVIQAFGQPAMTTTSDERTIDEYITRRKIAEPLLSEYLVIGDCATLGLGELIWFPPLAFESARRSINGQRLRYTFDDAGNVVEVDWDGRKQMSGLMTPHWFECPN